MPTPSRRNHKSQLKRSSQQIEAAQRIRDKWEENWQRFKDGGTFAIAWVIQKMQELGRAGDQAVQALNPKMLDVRINNAIADVNDYRQTAGAPDLQAALRSRARTLVTEKPTIDAATQRAIDADRISKAQQYLSLLGATTTAEEARRQVELQLQSAALNHVGIDAKRAETLKQLAYDQNLGLTAIRASADAYNIEAATVGMATGEAAKYTAVQNALNDARRNGRELLPEQIALIEREAEAMGRAAQRTDDLKFQYSTFSGTFKDFASNLRNGQNAWTAFGNAAQNALNKIIDKLIDMGTQQLWQAAFPSGMGGIGSIFSSIFGGGSSTYTSGPQGLNGMLGHNANGTDNWRGGPTWVGEQGPEIVNLPKGASVTSNKKIAAMMGAGGGTMGGQPVTVNIMNAPAGTSATSTSRRDARGGVQVDVMLKRTVDDNGASLIDSGESAMNKSLERRYGLSARL